MNPLDSLPLFLLHLIYLLCFFKEARTDRRWEQVFPRLKIFVLSSPMPSLPNHLPFHGETLVRHPPRRTCCVPRQTQGSFSPGAGSATRSALGLGSLLRSTESPKQEWHNADRLHEIISHLSLVSTFRGWREKAYFRTFTMLLERSSSLGFMLNLNQAVTQEAPTGCQFYKF